MRDIIFKNTMTKQKLTPEQTEIIRKETQEDPFDGRKTVGCLLIGIVLLIAVIYFFKMLINFLLS